MTDLSPDMQFYQAFRAAMRAYLKATAEYRAILDHYKRTQADPVEADIAAATDRRLKVAMGDQKFYAQEVTMYGIACLVELEARKAWPWAVRGEQ